MSVRNGLYCVLGLALGVLVSGSTGCGEYNYFSEVQGSGSSTGGKTDVAQMMQQMRVANLKLVDSLTYMNADGAQTYSVQMYELAKALEKTQPAVALQSPDDVAKYRKIADDLAEIIVQVGAAARDKRMDVADWNYTQAFPLCNRCHAQFRVAMTQKPLSIPEIEAPAPAPEAAPAAPSPAPEAAPEIPKAEPAPTK